MDHRLFEDWILEDQPLTPSQKRQLSLHLGECGSCAALAEVNLTLMRVSQAEPKAGFTGRFRLRLAERKTVLRRRNAWGFSLLTASVLGALSLVAAPFLKDLFTSPVNVLATAVASLASLWAALQALTRAGLVLFKVAPGFIPAYIWVVLLISAGGWSMAWIFSLMKFTAHQSVPGAEKSR
jgi:hypothetical protein